MTTPVTIAGKIFLIFYGLIGCAATILFFNLFLERVITVIAFVLKSCHERRECRKSGPAQNCQRPSTDSRERRTDSLAGWKPSVYCVMLILGVAAIVVSCCASAMYSAAEGWEYLDALYFCFVAFSTIGFGDMVSNQREMYKAQAAYRVGNFLFILTGVCCIYSLFNVISIVIKQVLNWLLRRLETPCRCPGRGNRNPRRNVVVPATWEPDETTPSRLTESMTARRMDGGCLERWSPWRTFWPLIKWIWPSCRSSCQRWPTDILAS